MPARTHNPAQSVRRPLARVAARGSNLAEKTDTMFPGEDEPAVAMVFAVDSGYQVRDLMYRMIEQRCQILADLGPDSRSLVSARLEVSGGARSMLLDSAPTRR